MSLQLKSNTFPLISLFERKESTERRIRGLQFASAVSIEPTAELRLLGGTVRQSIGALCRAFARFCSTRFDVTSV